MQKNMSPPKTRGRSISKDAQFPPRRRQGRLSFDSNLGDDEEDPDDDIEAVLAELDAVLIVNSDKNETCPNVKSSKTFILFKKM